MRKEKSEKKKSLLWLWILLGCLGLIVVGVIVFLLLTLFVFTKKEAKVIKKVSVPIQKGEHFKNINSTKKINDKDTYFYFNSNSQFLKTK